MELESCINYLLSVSQNTVFQYFSQQLSVHNITPAQYGVLNCLWNEEPLTPKQIGERLHLEASTISTILDKMQNNDLIARSIEPNNRRNILVFTTPKAILIKPSVEKVVLEMNNYFLEEFTPEERENLSMLLLSIISKHSKHLKK